MEGAIIAGLDIGTTKICAVIGKENRYGKLEIMGMGRSPSYGMKYAGIINVNKTVEAIQQAIQQAESQANVHIRAVNVGIAGHHIRHFLHSNTHLRSERDKVITMEDTQALMHEMYSIVLNPGCKIIHVVPQDYTIDDHSSLPNPIGMTGAKLHANFNIITANTKEIEEITRCVRSTRCETDLVGVRADSVECIGAYLGGKGGGGMFGRHWRGDDRYCGFFRRDYSSYSSGSDGWSDYYGGYQGWLQGDGA